MDLGARFQCHALTCGDGSEKAHLVICALRLGLQTRALLVATCYSHALTCGDDGNGPYDPCSAR